MCCAQKVGGLCSKVTSHIWSGLLKRLKDGLYPGGKCQGLLKRNARWTASISYLESQFFQLHSWLHCLTFLHVSLLLVVAAPTLTLWLDNPPAASTIPAVSFTALTVKQSDSTGDPLGNVSRVFLLVHWFQVGFPGENLTLQGHLDI